MWILKNSKDLLDNLKSRSFSQVSSIKTFDFSTLYTTLPHGKLKTRLKETIHGTIRTHWHADDLLKQCPSKGDKYVIDEELQHTDHLFLGVACFTFMNFV
jgi:Uri superfamily endonuclease